MLAIRGRLSVWSLCPSLLSAEGEGGPASLCAWTVLRILFWGTDLVTSGPERPAADVDFSLAARLRVTRTPVLQTSSGDSER
jgi:hypothetical protein